MAMGYFKKKNLISKIILLYLFLIFCNSCNLKEIKIEESKLMNTNIQTQKFDIEKYESNLKTNPLYEGYQKDERIFVKQFHTIKDLAIGLSTESNELLQHFRFKDESQSCDYLNAHRKQIEDECADVY